MFRQSGAWVLLEIRSAVENCLRKAVVITDVFSPTGLKRKEVGLLYVLAMFKTGAIVRRLLPETDTVCSSLDRNTDDGKQNEKNPHQIYSGYTKEQWPTPSHFPVSVLLHA